MAKLLKSNLRTQLTITIGIFLFIFILFWIISFQTLRELEVNGPVYKRIVQGKDLIADILPPPEYIVESYLVTLQMLGNSDSKLLEEQINRINTLNRDYMTRHDFWVAELEEGSMKRILIYDSYTPAREFYEILLNKFIPALEAGNIDMARRLAYGELRQKYEEHRTAIDAVVNMASDRNSQDETNAANSISVRTAILMSLGLLGIIITIGLSIFLSRGVTGTIKKVVTRLSEGAEQVASASGQVAGASQSLAHGSSEQASALEQSSSSLEEMTSIIKQNANNSRQANELAKAADVAADKGSKAMDSMARAMDEIKKSSDETARIIRVIDDIAFQTNLLALNAAVEAARAGEAGKGFAVVAEEVRNLAQRSAEAAKNTNSLIEGSQRNAEQGVRATQDFIGILNEITTGIKKVSELIGAITKASEEQSEGINQINKAVAQMDEVTQLSASNAEESASASEELASQAQELKEAVIDLSKIVGGNTRDDRLRDTKTGSSFAECNL